MSKEVFAPLQVLMSPYSTQLTALLETIILPLAEIDPQLAIESMAFVLAGDHTEILLKLNQRTDDKALVLLNKPGTYVNFWGQAKITIAQEGLAKAAKTARKDLYEKLFELLTSEQIIRLGQFFAAVTKQQNLAHLYPVLPHWFHYVVLDGLVTTFTNLGLCEQQHHKAVVEHWSLAKLEALLEVDQAGQGTHLIAFLFERQSVPSYYSDELDLIYSLSDTTSYLVEHLPQLEQLIPNLSIDAQIKFLDFLTKQDVLLLQLSQLIVQLTVSKSKKSA